MSNKRECSSNMNKSEKYIDNTFINSYVSEDEFMKKSLVLIKEIIKREHCKEKNKFKNELVIDLDQVERLYRKGTSNKECTVDFVVGLGNQQLLLVEAKFAVDNVDNIIERYGDKLKHSRDLLVAKKTFKSFYKKEIILLSNKNFERKYSRLRKLLISKYRTTEPMKLSEFYNEFFNRNNN